MLHAIWFSVASELKLQGIYQVLFTSHLHSGPQTPAAAVSYCRATVAQADSVGCLVVASHNRVLTSHFGVAFFVPWELN
jgi:hypothetical protein